MSESEVQLNSIADADERRHRRWLVSKVDDWFARLQPTVAEPLDTEIRVVSPENISFKYRVAGPFPRMLAFMVDILICVLIFAAFYILMILFGALLSMLGMGAVVDRMMMVIQALISVATFLIWWFYAAILETWMNGQTLAKRWFGLRVLSVDGNPINGLQATLRTIIRAAEALPVVTLQVFDPWIQPLFEDMAGTNGQTPAIPILPTFLVGLLAMMLTKRFQRVGDLVCGTMVVREVRTWGHGIAKLEDPRVPHLAEYIPASFVFSQSLSKALAAYVDRRRFFSVARRTEIASHLAEPLLEKFGLPEDTSFDLFMCALYYRAFVADQGREDAIDLRLNAETRRFEGVVPEHRFRQPNEQSGSSSSSPSASSAQPASPWQDATPTHSDPRKDAPISVSDPNRGGEPRGP